MKIAFNPSTVAALIAPPNNKDITFDLRGHNIFARGVKFCGTDTWRDIKINNVNIGSNILDLRDGDNTTLTNINGVVTINSTWRPVVDNLTSDSTTSSLSANQGRILKALIDGKSDSDHNHDDRYLRLTGGTMLGALNFANGTWNLVGDDSYMGDCNISGHFGIKAANTTYPGISFFDNANAHLGNLTTYNGNIKYGAYSLQFLDNGNTSVSASTWMNPFSDYNSNAVADGQAICVWGQSSYLGNLANDTGDMSLWLRRVNANVATLNMVLDGEYYANGNQRLAHVSEIPNSLKNPYALTISLNGTSQGPYDGSAAKNINITPSSIGAATSNHNHDGRYVYNYGNTANVNGQALNQNALFMSTTSGITEDWWHILQAAWNDEYRWNSQIAFPTQNRNGMYYRSGLDDNTAWGAWVKLLDVNNYSSTLDSRYYTESEVNSFLDAKLNRQNLSYGTWNPRGYNLAADYSYNGGDLSISESGGQIHVSVDGYFWQNEGQYRVLDTSDVAGLKNNLTVHQYLSNTDTTWWPLIWGGSSHNNTSDSTGEVYKSHDVLSWQTSSQTLHATNIQTNNIKNLSIGGGIYWNPYVESASDGSDAASITLVKSGVAGGTTLVLSQMNDANDTIQFQTNGSARLYHNSYPILTTQNTYVNNNKGYINGTEITQVNNADTVDYYHADSLFRDLGWWAESETHDANDITGNGAVFAYRNHSNVPTWGVLVTFRGGSDGYRWQMAKSYGNRTLYIRQRDGDNGTWSNWLRLLDESDLTWNNIAGKPNTFTPAAHTHTVFNNNLMIKGTNGISDSASIHLGIGDSDTGFKWISDGKCQIYANNVAVGEWTSGGMNWFKNPTVNGNKVWNAGNDGSGSGLDADTVDGYHASSLWRSDGGIWNPGANISLTASGNNQEWSFDITRNGYTGCYWHVWDSALSTLLEVNADNGKVYAPYNFVGNLEGNAYYATKSEYSRSLLGRSTSGSDYGADSSNLVFAEWNTMNDNRWYLKATGYECRVAFASSAGNADTTDGVHITWAGVLTSTSHLVAWESDGSALRDINPANVSVGYASSAGNADMVDGYHASDFASSSHSHNYAANENYGGFTKSGRLPISGFYQSNESEGGDNAPWSSWMHLINCQHSNVNNNYALQIAASFYDNNTFKIRVTNDNVNNDWRDIIHSGNIGSQSVNYANSAGNADTTTNAYHLRINSANTWSTWYWAGQSGQPSWLWGSNDGTNMYVWDPNNFNVHTAQYLRSLGNQNCQTGRTQNYGDVYTYNTRESNTGAPTGYTSVIGFGRGTAGTVEIAGGWCNTGLYWRSLRDCCEDWYSWRTVLDSSNYTGYVDNYYWANVKISTSSSTTTSPTVSNLTATSSIRMGNIQLEHTDEINNITDGHIYLNFRNSGNVSLCEGGGKVGIGTTAPSYKLDVVGDIHSSGTINCNALNVGSTLNIKDSVINCSSSNISIKSKESGSLMIGSQEVIRYESDYTDFYNKVNFLYGLSLRTGTIGFTQSTYTTDDVTVLIGTIMQSQSFYFKPASDGQLLFLKIGREFSNVYFLCTAKDCEVVKANGFDVHLARNVTKNYFGDGLSRIFIYKQLDERWYEFYCG